MLCLILPLLLGFQDITLPPEIKTESGKFIIITAQTKGDEVKFVPLSDGLQILDRTLLKDPKSLVVVANKNGSYKILAYTQVAGKLSDPAFTEIKVGEKEPLPPNNNALKEIVQSVYGADASPNKEPAKNALLQGFTDLAKALPELDSVGALNAKLKALLAGKISNNEISALRDVISDHLKAQFGLNPNASLDPTKAKQVIDGIIDALKSL